MDNARIGKNQGLFWDVAPAALDLLGEKDDLLNGFGFRQSRYSRGF